MSRYNLGISPLGSCGLFISGIRDCTARSSGNSGVCTGQLCSPGLGAVVISQGCVMAKQETALGSCRTSFFRFWNLVLVREDLSTGLAE